MTRIHNFSESFEMYLKTVDELQDGEHPIPVTAVAERLGVATVSASEMVHRLQDLGLLTHKPYSGVFLTDAGRKAANNVVRAHRLWECFLVEELGFDWVAAHEAACNLEHVSSEEIIAGLESLLGGPERCPHGNLIPEAGAWVEPEELPRLSDLEPGDQATVVAIRPESTPVLEALATRGLIPATVFTVAEIEVFDGPRELLIDGQKLAVGRRLADHVLVRALG